MKKLIIIAAITLGLSLPLMLSAQQPPHPNGTTTANPPSGANRVGDAPAAPVGNGAFILLTLAMAYAGRKAYSQRTDEVEE